MKKFLFVLLIAGSLTPSSIQASHFFGGDIHYEYIGDSTGTPNHYLLHVNLYRRFTGASLSSSLIVKVSSNCSPPNLQVTLNRYIPTGATAAGDGGYYPPIGECVEAFGQTNLVAISVHSYKKDIVLTGNCLHTFSTTQIGRYFSANLNPYSGDLYLSATLKNTLGTNNAPGFEQAPQVYHCINQNVSANFTTIQGEGDSVHYELVAPQTSYGTPYGYKPGFSAKQPISTTSGVVLDSVNGILWFSPSAVENVVVKVRASEYRYDSLATVWNFIGSSERDIIYIIGGSCAPSVMDFTFSKDSTGFDTAATVYCTDSTFRIRTDQPFLISSLAGDGSDFSILGNTGKSYSIASARSFDHINSLYARGIEIRLQDSIDQDDTLTVYPQTGTDQNSLINHCGYEQGPTDSVMITALDTCTSQGLPSSLHENKLNALIHLYPNPAGDVLHIEIPPQLSGNLEKLLLLDANGRVLTQLCQPDLAGRNFKLNTTTLQRGIFALQMQFADGQSFTKVFVRE